MVPQENKNQNTLPQTEKQALHLEKTVANNNNPYVFGLLWHDDNVELPDKENFAPSSCLS